jgi:hypothetical protein
MVTRRSRRPHRTVGTLPVLCVRSVPGGGVDSSAVGLGPSSPYLGKARPAPRSGRGSHMRMRSAFSWRPAQAVRRAAARMRMSTRPRGRTSCLARGLRDVKSSRTNRTCANGSLDILCPIVTVGSQSPSSQTRFVQENLTDSNAIQAAIRAGYSAMH